MTQQHTNEAWSIKEANPKQPLRIENSEGALIAKLTELDRANARRIVACVNACAGISTERLEKFLGATANKSVITLTTDNIDLKKQRDELLAVLESLIDMDVAYNRGSKVEDAVEKAEATIASVKEKS